MQVDRPDWPDHEAAAAVRKRATELARHLEQQFVSLTGTRALYIRREPKTDSLGPRERLLLLAHELCERALERLRNSEVNYAWACLSEARYQAGVLYGMGPAPRDPTSRAKIYCHRRWRARPPRNAAQKTALADKLLEHFSDGSQEEPVARRTLLKWFAEWAEGVNVPG